MGNKIRFVIIELKHILCGLSNNTYMINLITDEMVGRRFRISEPNNYNKYLEIILAEEQKSNNNYGTRH
jgi:hypothetical protein